MFMGFSGTFDMALVSTSTVGHLQSGTLASDIAMISPENFYNFARVRPITRIDTSGSRVIDWPGVEIKVATFSDVDMIFVTGEEPQYMWSTMSAHISEIAKKTGCKLAISLGAVNGIVPHTRDLPVYGYTTNADVSEKMNLERPKYEGPTGYMASLNGALEDAGIPSIAVRVEVPHYLPSPPSPKAVQALLSYLGELLDVDTYAKALDPRVKEWEHLVNEAVAIDEENVTYVEQLEEQHDSEEELASASKDLVLGLESFLADNSVVIEDIEIELDDQISESLEEVESEDEKPEDEETGL